MGENTYYSVVRVIHNIFSPHMSEFSKAHGCQDVLLNFTNNAKLSLDHRNVTPALLTDLSKAFDCLPYKLLLSKLHAYGVDRNACLIILVISLTENKE